MLIALPVLLAAAQLQAQESSSQLFREGVRLFQSGKVDKACAKFEQSYALDEAAGTLFNLASCHEKEGQLWKARQEFKQLASEMNSAGKTDKAELAEKRAEAVEARLPKLQLVFPPDSKVTAILLDGDPLPKAKWGQAVPVSPGSHEVTFKAPGKETRTVSVAAQGDAPTTVQVPELAAEPPPATGKPPAPVAKAKPPSADRGTEQPDWWTTKREAAAVLGGVGVIGLGVGAVLGLEAISKKGKADDACGTSADVCLDAAHAKAAKAEMASAKGTATVSTVGFGVGIAALAVGGYLWFSEKSPRSEEKSLVVMPEAGPRSAGVLLNGNF